MVEQRLSKSETERAELHALEQSLKEQVDKLKIDSEAAIRTKEDELEQMKREVKRQEESFQLKVQQIEGSSAQSQRKLKEVESEHEKEKALMDQKI
jgi:HAMP domain-containing protein